MKHTQMPKSVIVGEEIKIKKISKKSNCMRVFSIIFINLLLPKLENSALNNFKILLSKQDANEKSRIKTPRPTNNCYSVFLFLFFFSQ